LNLALSAWDELDLDFQKPLGAWLEERADGAKVVSLPDGDVRLPEATNFFDATTVYFGKSPPVSHVCSTRTEAELITAIAARVCAALCLSQGVIKIANDCSKNFTQEWKKLQPGLTSWRNNTQEVTSFANSWLKFCKGGSFKENRTDHESPDVRIARQNQLTLATSHCSSTPYSPPAQRFSAYPTSPC
jgi:hypothetical protein